MLGPLAKTRAADWRQAMDRAGKASGVAVLARFRVNGSACSVRFMATTTTPPAGLTKAVASSASRVEAHKMRRAPGCTNRAKCPM